ncbi:hypothetical protein L1049_000182 [Liquidambar formosana]|uniref:COBRA C-terminal domain-containing protein n=1 Tax=Liquidambar formosana TaxID=63359 RepID=A0AAP0NA42_LIQFO
MKTTKTSIKTPWTTLLFFSAVIFAFSSGVGAQDYEGETPPAPPPESDNCDGIFLSYTFISRQKEYPHVKNSTAQSWAFKAMATVLNAGLHELKAWKIFVGFQHEEILVAASGAVIVDGEDFPAHVGNGTYMSGYPQADLETSIDTAGDINQIQVQIEMTGTQFGVKPPGVPMPRTIRLVNDGYKCPGPKRRGSSMYVCCKRDPKYKVKPKKKTKFLPRQNGDLSLTYDVIQTFEGSYLAQVTIDNNNPLGRLDHWNLTWEWMRGEFINTMRGAYTHKKDPAECIYGVAAQYYPGLDFSSVMNCQKNPVISDLPADRAKDEKVGNLPYCCRNGSLLPTIMNATKARSIFQLQVYKIPPDMNRTALTPPQKWKINGVINPNYKCGPPIRVDATEFPDPSGLQAITSAIASWQLTTTTLSSPATPALAAADSQDTCSASARPLLLPPEALLVPFENRTTKAKAWAKIKHYPIPKPLPCPDNCGVSINWHIYSDYKKGWTARITLFNWDDVSFEDWFTAIQMKKAYPGFENVYSFNGTKLPELNNTIFFQGLPGLNYLVGESNGTDPKVDPRVPGKQQSVISFTKKLTPGINIPRGDGFPTKVIFNGEECSLPTDFPIGSGGYRSNVNFLPVIFLSIMTFVLMTDRFH